MPPKLDPQLALDERAINDPDLEKALELHLRAKDDASEAGGVVKSRRADVDAALAKHGDFPADSALRIGRFRITKRHIEASVRSFETKARDQLLIGLVDEDGAAAKRTAAASEASVSDDFDDLRPTGDVNTDALRGEADRASEPTPFRPKKPVKGADLPSDDRPSPTH